MQIVEIRRSQSSDEGTFGKLFIDNKFFCCTGELPDNAGNPDVPNERSTDCIPKGEYEVHPKQSPKFGSTYEVKNVPNRSAILIHAGNFCGNVKKGWRSDVEGCILLGTATGCLGNQKAVLRSKEAVDKFKLFMGKKPFKLLIS